MYFYNFIIIYLAISISNGFLFKDPPLNKSGELNAESKDSLIKYFNTNKTNRRLTYKSFTRLFNSFKWLHGMEDSDIDKLFTDEVKNKKGLMNLNKFLKQSTKCIKITESLYKLRYNNSLNEEKKMTLNELKKVLVVKELDITEELVTTLITDYKFTNEQDISMEEFRKTFVSIMYNQIYTIPVKIALQEMRRII
ncbi:uncharacterized protein LOC126900283 isoform X1 [Daktulosphaira vitifoliae]|uniref:uncharacterized protein LOC126900283 isoform X1 n=2 Tax=Daktulosphaira vitifoliae TaxID=58002 RepID=UPI0021AAFD78|nr:uncharacterized protein LOC126900283 isoform X1 [Daktulosphaira vitifoliae]